MGEPADAILNRLPWEKTATLPLEKVAAFHEARPEALELENENWKQWHEARSGNEAPQRRAAGTHGRFPETLLGRRRPGHSPEAPSSTTSTKAPGLSPSWSFTDLLLDAVKKSLSDRPQDLSRCGDLKRQALEQVPDRAGSNRLNEYASRYS